LLDFLKRRAEEGEGWKSKERAMAGGGVAALGVKKERAAEYKGRMTWAVAMACLVAAVGGSIFGYDIGISGNFFVSARTRFCCVHDAVCARVRGGPRGEISRCHYTSQTNILLVFWGVTHYD
jgi:hypothetical protein